MWKTIKALSVICIFFLWAFYCYSFFSSYLLSSSVNSPSSSVYFIEILPLSFIFKKVSGSWNGSTRKSFASVNYSWVIAISWIPISQKKCLEKIGKVLLTLIGCCSYFIDWISTHFRLSVAEYFFKSLTFLMLVFSILSFIRLR